MRRGIGLINRLLPSLALLSGLSAGQAAVAAATAATVGIVAVSLMVAPRQVQQAALPAIPSHTSVRTGQPATSTKAPVPSSGTPPPSTTPSSATAATPPPSTTVQAPVKPGHFPTLPVGAALPSDTTCAAEVRPAAETRPANKAYNNTTGTTPNSRYPRADGNYTGTTDEIIQWTACKWGIDEDIIRAEAAKETGWFQRNTGDFTTDTSACVPGHQTLGADGTPGECPVSIGIMQVSYPFYSEAFQDNNAVNSTAYNLDVTYAYLRDCYEGNLTWLNNVDRGKQYAAGDIWGCVGVWFSGRWYTDAAVQYINAVKDYMNQRVWEQSWFLNMT